MILRGFLAIELRMGLDELENYLNTTEEYLQKARGEFNIQVDEQLKTIPPEESDEFNEFYGELSWNYAEVFPRIMRSSFFVTVYFLFEHKLSIICRHLKKEQQIPINWSDLRGGTLDQFKNYCKLAGLDLIFSDRNWQEISKYRIVRNCIVHNKGLVEGARQERELRSYITRENIISKDTIREEIALTEQFCREAIKVIWAFLSKFLEAYELQKQSQAVG